MQGTTRGGRLSKRLFDLAITLSSAIVWAPVLGLCALAIFVCEGRPIFYISQREVGPGQTRSIIKFRTMQKNADKLYNRDTVPVNGTRFLNIPRESPVYTTIGRLIEQLALTELPQLLHVVAGHMSLIGSRPLPTRVMDALRQIEPLADERFLSKTGLTGPVQLIGRDRLTDVERISLEIEYCRLVQSNRYTIVLDFWLLLYTVAVVINPSWLLTDLEVRRRMHRLVGETVAETNTSAAAVAE